jgi:hypothetical protein
MDCQYPGAFLRGIDETHFYTNSRYFVLGEFTRSDAP